MSIEVPTPTPELRYDSGPRFTDWHCHILPGIDDGAANDAEATAMARILSRAGFRRLICTPHMLASTGENPPSRVREATASLDLLLRRENVDLEIHSGMEYYADEFIGRRMSDPLTLPGGMLLVELPLNLDIRLSWDLLSAVTSRRITPLVAHPERHPLLVPGQPVRGGFFASLFGRSRNTSSPLSPLELLREKGCRFQGNLGSFAGVYGEKVRRRAMTLLEEGWYDRLGSDAHNAKGLERLLGEGLATVEKSVGSRGLARLLSEDDEKVKVRQ